MSTDVAKSDPTVEPAAPRGGIARPWAWGVLLGVAVAVVYLPSFRGAFVFDDMSWIVNNAALRSPTCPSLGTVRPVIRASLWVNFRLGGLNVAGYHTVNFAVHLIAGLTLFGLVRRTLRLPPLDQRWGMWADRIAFVTALLWLIHPLQTQSVTYIIQRCESMMAMFLLLTLYGLLRASQSPRPLGWYGLAVVACGVGVGCKESMLIAPLLLLLFDRVFLSPSWRAVVRARWAFYLALLPAEAWLFAFTASSAPSGGPAASPPPSRWEYLCSQPAIILHYLRLAVLPDKLCLDYAWPTAQSWLEWALPGGILLGLFLASVLLLYYRPRLGFLACSFFILLAPASSFAPLVDLAMEHRMYLPLAALILMAVLVVPEVFARWLPRPRDRAVIYAAVVALLAVSWGVRTFSRNHLYSNPAGLWANVLASAPDNARAHNNLACYLEQEGDLPRAAEAYLRAMELDPQLRIACCNLARVRAKQHDLDEAVRLMRHATTIGAEAAWIRCELGEHLESRGDTEEALAQYRRAVELDADFGRAQYRLGRLLARENRPAEAVPCFLEALKCNPTDVGCNFRLALAYQRTGDFPAAIAAYQRTLQIEPGLEKARRNLKLCRAGRRDGEAASDELKTKAVRPQDAPPAGRPTAALSPTRP